MNPRTQCQERFDVEARQAVRKMLRLGQAFGRALDSQVDFERGKCLALMVEGVPLFEPEPNGSEAFDFRTGCIADASNRDQQPPISGAPWRWFPNQLRGTYGDALGQIALAYLARHPEGAYVTQEGWSGRTVDQIRQTAHTGTVVEVENDEAIYVLSGGEMAASATPLPELDAVTEGSWPYAAAMIPVVSLLAPGLDGTVSIAAIGQAAATAEAVVVDAFDEEGVLLWIDDSIGVEAILESLDGSWSDLV